MGAINPGTALFPKTRGAILGLLFGRPERSFYLREIVELAGIGMGQTQRELQRLTESGILRRSERGRHVYFQANELSPVYLELRGLVAKTVGMADSVREALRPLEERIRIAFLFGSVARSEEGADSDIDLFVVGEVSLRDVVSTLAESQARLGREISPTVYPENEFRSRVASRQHFLESVLDSEKIFLIGSQDELGKLLA